METVLIGKAQGLRVTRGQQFLLSAIAAMPNGPYGMNDLPRLQAMGVSNARFACRAAAQSAALF